jgi:hypothetical protein
MCQEAEKVDLEIVASRKVVEESEGALINVIFDVGRVS